MRVTYLGHKITEKGVLPDPQKILAVREFPRPKTPKHIKQFLGLAGYYRRFVPHFANIAKPLTALLKKRINFKWEEKQEKAFCTLKDILCSEPFLQYPKFSEPFVLTIDASNKALGVVLSQSKIGQDLPIAYASRTLNNTEKKYATWQKELYAIMFGLKQFRPYLYGGHKVYLVTNNKSLQLIDKINGCDRVQRWKMDLKDYNYEVIYKPGKLNKNADALSRNPVLTITYTDDEHKNTYSQNIYELFLKGPKVTC